MLTAPARRLAEFEGLWQLERRVTDGSGRQARLSGEARWTREGEALAYHEAGLLTMQDGPPIRAERRLTWRAGLQVFFEDGRFFHAVPPLGGRVSHWCDPDSYEGNYDFDAWPDFEVSWVVNGPRKDYHMHTIYRRARG